MNVHLRLHPRAPKIPSKNSSKSWILNLKSHLHVIPAFLLQLVHKIHYRLWFCKDETTPNSSPCKIPIQTLNPSSLLSIQSLESTTFLLKSGVPSTDRLFEGKKKNEKMGTIARKLKMKIHSKGKKHGKEGRQQPQYQWGKRSLWEDPKIPPPPPLQH